MSKNYGFPTGYFSLIYNYLCDNDQIERFNDDDILTLLEDFGYPRYIIPYLAQEFIGY